MLRLCQLIMITWSYPLDPAVPNWRALVDAVAISDDSGTQYQMWRRGAIGDLVASSAEMT
jgi:hypothetical protein